jgi:hypothetical protein
MFLILAGKKVQLMAKPKDPGRVVQRPVDDMAVFHVAVAREMLVHFDAS